MVQPASINNTRGQSTDTGFGPDGTARVKLLIGDVDVGLTPHAAWQAAASHMDGDTFVASDGVMVAAGIDGTTVRKLLADSLGRLVAAITPSGGNFTDRSGTLTVGATDQTIAAANTARKYFFVHNIDATETMWINFGVAAVQDQPSIKLVAGASFVMEGSFVSTQAIHLIATTIGHKFTAKEG